METEHNLRRAKQVNTYDEVLFTVKWAWSNELADDYPNATLEAEATARKVWRDIAPRLDPRFRTWPLWRQEEYIHLVTLDWFSHFEPEFTW